MHAQASIVLTYCLGLIVPSPLCKRTHEAKLCLRVSGRDTVVIRRKSTVTLKPKDYVSSSAGISLQIY